MLPTSNGMMPGQPGAPDMGGPAFDMASDFPSLGGPRPGQGPGGAPGQGMPGVPHLGGPGGPMGMPPSKPQSELYCSQYLRGTGTGKVLAVSRGIFEVSHAEHSC